MTHTPTTGSCDAQPLVMNPMDKSRGLCLASTAIQKGDLSALASTTDTSGSPKTSPGSMTIYPSSPVVADEPLARMERCSTTNILPGPGFWSRTPYVQLEKNRVGELSLSDESECLSLHVSLLSAQGKIGNAETLLSSPHMNVGASRKGRSG